MIKTWKELTRSEQERRRTIQIIEEQDQLESSMIEYIENLSRDPSSGTPEQHLAVEIVKTIGSSVVDYINNIYKQNVPWIRPIVELGPLTTAHITACCLYDCMFLSAQKQDTDTSYDFQYGAVPASELARTIAQTVITNAEYRLSQKENRQEWHKTSGIIKNWDDRSINKFLRKFPPSQKVTATLKEKLLIGNHLLQILEKAGFITRYVRRVDDKTIAFISFTEDVAQGLASAHSHFMMNAAIKYRPMIAPPVPHSVDATGGALLQQLRKPVVDKALVFFKSGELSTDYRNSKPSQVTINGINHLMATEWAINERVLSVMDELFKASCTFANLPPIERDPLMESSSRIESDDPEVIAEHVLNKRIAWGNWFHRENDRIRMYLRLRIARDMVDGSRTFFHVYTCDFRGRGYTTTDLLSPQSGDHDRSLITFAKAVKQTDRGMYWLKVHVANCFDQDKVSFDDRIKWVDDNIAMLCLINSDPVGYLSLWASDTTDGTRIKKDKSFQKLAAVFELFRTDGMTQLPIQMDGSCNGIQWWAAQTKDIVVGKRVNLLPDVRPDDIYQQVADNCVKICKASNDDWHRMFMEVWDAPKKWRKVVKRSVMTDPYGVTAGGIRSGLIADGFLNNFESKKASSNELSRLIIKAKDELLNSANALKMWLRDSTDAISRLGKHVTWTTPSGFRVNMEYRESLTVHIESQFDKKRTGIYFNVYDKNSVDKAGSKNGISPNFIHSLDASHMWMTICGMGEDGVDSFSFIHDSYGCHAPDVDMMRNKTREKFVNINQQDLFQNLKDEWETIYGITLDPLPPRGDLDITKVLESEYFFH